MRLSAQTTLLIAVVALVVVVASALLFVLYRVLRRPAPPVPLPPKQELARYREQHAHVSRPRPPTWYDSALLSAPLSDRSIGSKSSLVPADSRTGSPSRRPSLNVSESPSDDTFASMPMPLPLGLPHLPFDTSSTSLSTAEPDSPASFSPPLGSASDSSLSHTPARHPRSPSASSRRPRRPLSVSSGTSRTSGRNTIRGVPHGPHSQVQIILPAPLAFSDRMSTHENSPRFSVVDQWAPMAVRSEGNPNPNRIPRPPRRSISSSEPRRSRMLPPAIAPHVRRASASASLPHPPAAHHNRDYPSLPSRLSPPPVPPIPQQWLPDPLMGIPEDSGRGRARGVVSGNPPPPVDWPSSSRVRA